MNSFLHNEITLNERYMSWFQPWQICEIFLNHNLCKVQLWHKVETFTCCEGHKWRSTNNHQQAKALP